MDIVGLGLGIVGTITILVSSIWLIVCAFKKSIAWGLLYTFVPFASLVYLFMDWNRAWKPFVLSLAGIVICGIGIAVSPSLQQAFTNSNTHVASP